MLKGTFLGIHSHAAVVADMFMTSGSDIEERSLSAVGITHQCDLDQLAAFFRKGPHLLVNIFFRGIYGREGFVMEKHLLGFAFTDDLYLRGFLTAK